MDVSVIFSLLRKTSIFLMMKMDILSTVNLVLDQDIMMVQTDGLVLIMTF